PLVADRLGFLPLEVDDLLQPRSKRREVVGLAGLLPDLLRSRRDPGDLLDQLLGQFDGPVVGPAHFHAGTSHRAPCACEVGCQPAPRAHTLDEAEVVRPWPAETRGESFTPTRLFPIYRKARPAYRAGGVGADRAPA